MPVNLYLESVDDNSLSAFGFSQDAGSGSATYQFGDADSPVTSTDDLQGAITDILGTTETDVGTTQALRRTLPCTHPCFPYLYASQLTGMLGIGSGDAERKGEVIPPVTGSPQAIADTFQLYKRYQIRANFSTRPYTILPDEQIPIQTGTWWPDDVLRTTTATSFTYAAEWLRYTDWWVEPRFETIQGSQGGFQFHSAGGAPVDGAPFTSPPWMYLPDDVLKVVWHQVPYIFVTHPSSYIANRGWQGRVNQNPWYNWPAGSLLYLTYSVKRYNQPSLKTQTLTDLNSNTWTAYSKLCDVEFTFLRTTRTMTGSLSANPKYGNWVAAGHNLQPWFGPPNSATSKPGFFYATAVDGSAPADDTKWRAPWASCPFEALFSDPRVAGGP